jgi:hypothetical protein
MYGKTVKKKKMVEVFEFSHKFIEVSRYLVFQMTIRFPAELRLIVNESDWRTHQRFPLYQVPGPRSKQLNEGGHPS